jgi:hypothetical protein
MIPVACGGPRRLAGALPAAPMPIIAKQAGAGIEIKPSPP